SVLCLLGAVVNWRAPSRSLAWVDSAWASAFGSISSDIASASFDEWRDVIGQGHVTGDGRRRARVSRRFEGARPSHAQNNERNSPDHDISQLHVGLAFYRTGSIVDLLRVYTVTLRGGLRFNCNHPDRSNRFGAGWLHEPEQISLTARRRHPCNRKPRPLRASRMYTLLRHGRHNHPRRTPP